MIGETVSHYRIIEELGRGGMGVVYKAEDTKLKRDVALKFLPPEMTSDPDARGRFIKEAQTASALDHPNIGVIHEIEETNDGRSFICMALYDGETLKQKMERGPLGVPEIIKIGIQVADGLKRAHEAGIVHRDIKPANILVTRDGVVKIVDFGVAKLAGGAGQSTTGSWAGTVAYMSPEQIQNRPVDARSDLWSLGVVLYEMATGTRPFAGEHEAALFYSIVYNEPVPPRKLRAEIPETLNRIIMRLLQKDPVKRPQTSGELLISLRELTAPSGVSKVEQGISHVRRYVTRKSLTIALAVMVVAAAAILVPFGLRSAFNHLVGIGVPPEKHIVVLPFTCIGCSAKESAMADGLTETLTSTLTQFNLPSDSLWVVASSEVKGDNVKTPSDARRIFGANLVITGSVQHMEGGLRLTLNLVNPETSRQLRSHVFDESTASISRLQEKTVDILASFLNVRLDGESVNLMKAGETSKSKAYESYLQARGYMQRYEKEENLVIAASLFRKAFGEDSGYALAYAGLGEVYWRMFEDDRDARWVDSAIVFSSRAVQLNGSLAPVHFTLGMIYEGTGRNEKAVGQFREAIRLDPANGYAHAELGEAYSNLGDTSNAEAAFREAITISPKYWGFHNYLGKYYLIRGHTRDAMSQFRRVIDLTPDNYRGYSNLGGAYFYLGKFDSALVAFEKSVSLEPDYVGYSNIGTILYYKGKFPGAAEAYEKALKINDKDYLVWANLAAAYSQTGNKEKSLAAYRTAVNKGGAILRLNPENAALMEDIAGYYISLGEKEKAKNLISTALAASPANVMLVGRAAMAYEELGERSTALRLLAEAFKNGYSPTEVENAPEMKGLRKDPRFIRLVKEISPKK